MATIEELKKLITDVKSEMLTKANFDELLQKIAEKDQRIEQLEERVERLETDKAYLQKQNSLLERRVDDQESYYRRQNLRIVGIPPPRAGQKESADEVTAKVKEAIAALGTDIDVDNSIDRAHRVGKRFTKEGTGEVFHPIIVRFTSWRSRTAVYRNRERQGAVRFYTDLTKRRLDLKKLADQKTRNNAKVKFAFADTKWNSLG